MKKYRIIIIYILSLSLVCLICLFHYSGYGKCRLGELYFTKGGNHYFCSNLNGEITTPQK